jgi:hypothetical membrane protein
VVQVGAAAWIAGTVQFFAAGLVVQSAWRTPYSWASNAISDLGAAHCQRTGADNPPDRYVCSPLHAAMNTSFFTLGLLLACGTLLTGPAWGRGAAGRIAQGLLVAAGGGMILAARWPEDVNLNLHVLGALLIMGIGNIGFVVAAAVRRRSPVGRLWPVTLPLSLLGLVATGLMFSHHTALLGYGGTERVALYPLLGWTVLAGICLLRPAARPAAPAAAFARPEAPRAAQWEWSRPGSFRSAADDRLGQGDLAARRGRHGGDDAADRAPAEE